MGARHSHSLSDFHGDVTQSDFDVGGFYAALRAFCEPCCLACSRPFLVSWYNETREATAGGSQRIDAPPDSVAFAIYSVPGYLETVADYYRRQTHAAPLTTGYVDPTTDEILEQLRGLLRQELDVLVINTDKGPPYYHVQTMGAVAGVDEHFEAEDIAGADAEEWREDLSDRLEDSRDPKMWGHDLAGLRKIFGVNMHPVWGGWYAYRGLIVLRGAQAGSLARPQPLRFLSSEQKRRSITEYNLRHAECTWRDLSEKDHSPSRRYTTDEFFFFTEVSPAKRRRWLGLRAAQMEARISGSGSPAWLPSAAMVAQVALLAVNLSLAAVQLYRCCQTAGHRRAGKHTS